MRYEHNIVLEAGDIKIKTQLPMNPCEQCSRVECSDCVKKNAYEMEMRPIREAYFKDQPDINTFFKQVKNLSNQKRKYRKKRMA